MRSSEMKVTLHYGDGVLCLPEDVLSHLNDLKVNGDTLKVLLCLAADHSSSIEDIASRLDITPKKVSTALAFWQEAGVVSIDNEPSAQKSAKAPATETTDPKSTVRTVSSAPKQSATAPRYTTDELAALLESRRELSELVDECSRVLGKVLNTHEVGTLLGIVDYLGVTGEYLLLLLAHCDILQKIQT